MPWDLNSDRPIYAQIIEQMELKICSGIYPLGSKLPSVRDLAQEASVNPNTMQRALAKLEEDGMLYSIRTSGRFVTEDASMIEQVKKKLAQDHIEEFFEKMSKLGFKHHEVLSIIASVKEEIKK